VKVRPRWIYAILDRVRDDAVALFLLNATLRFRAKIDLDKLPVEYQTFHKFARYLRHDISVYRLASFEILANLYRADTNADAHFFDFIISACEDTNAYRDSASKLIRKCIIERHIRSDYSPTFVAKLLDFVAENGVKVFDYSHIVMAFDCVDYLIESGESTKVVRQRCESVLVGQLGSFFESVRSQAFRILRKLGVCPDGAPESMLDLACRASKVNEAERCAFSFLLTCQVVSIDDTCCTLAMISDYLCQLI
jgi:hypothetical protein